MVDSPRDSEVERLRLALIAYRDAAEIWLDTAGRLGNSERQLEDRLSVGRMVVNRFRRFVEAENLIALFDRLPGIRARGEVLQTELPARLGADDVRRRLCETTDDLEDALLGAGPDREHVRRLLASLDEAGRRLVLGEDRLAVFEAEARMRGVDAEALVGSVLIAPASDGRTCDLAAVQSIGGLQAHRAGTEATVYRPMNGYADLRHDGFPVNLDPDRDEPLLSTLGAESMLDRVLHSRYEFLEYRVASDAPLHRRVDVGFGEVQPHAGPMDAIDEDDTADMVLPIFLPVRHAAMELWLHRGVRRDPRSPWPAFLQSFERTSQLGSDVESATLERVGGFSAVANPIEETSGLVSFSSLRRELLDRAADRLGVSLADFEVFRFSEPHPPVGSGLRVFWRLAAPG